MNATYDLYCQLKPLVEYNRFLNAGNLVKNVIKNNIPGSIVEIGIYTGGTLAYMSKIAENSNRKIYGFDSFEGLPLVEKIDGKKVKKYEKKCVASEKDVKKSLSIAGIKDTSNIKIIKGWIENTVKLYIDEIKPIAILRIDVDLYKATKFCLEIMYDLVSPGGWVIIDDYYKWQGQKLATQEFIEKRQIKNTIKNGCEIYWKK